MKQPAMVLKAIALACVATTVLAGEIPIDTVMFPSYIQYVQNQCYTQQSELCNQLTNAIGCGSVAPGSCGITWAYLDSSYETAATGVCLLQPNLRCAHYLSCPLNAADVASARCTVDEPNFRSEVATVDPNSILKWSVYVRTCSGSNYNPAVTSPGTCSQLSGELCSRPDVYCDGTGTTFLDVNTGLPALTSDPATVSVSYANLLTTTSTLTGTVTGAATGAVGRLRGGRLGKML